MSLTLICGAVLPRPFTQTARNRLFEEIIPQWKQMTNTTIELATFGSLEGNLFLCFVIKRFSADEEKELGFHGMFAKPISHTDPLVVSNVTEQLTNQIGREWQSIRGAALSTYSQTLETDLMYVLIKEYPLRLVS